MHQPWSEIEGVQALKTQSSSFKLQFSSAFGWLREATLWVSLGVALLLWLLSYQGNYRAVLAIGGDTEARRRFDDAPYLRGFNAPEPADNDAAGLEWWQVTAGTATFPYRWAEPEASLLLPGVGGGPWILSLTASSGRPEPVESVVRAGGWEQRLMLAGGTPRRYMLALPPQPDATLDLRISSPQLVAPGDPRRLGIVIHRVALIPLATALRVPPLATLAALAVTLLLTYGLLRRQGLPCQAATSLLLVLAALVAWLLLRYRIALTVFAPTLPWLLLTCYLLAEATTWAIRSWQKQVPVATRALAQRVVLLAVVAFALRLGGMLHPHVIFNDLGLNTNNLRGVLMGEIIFTEGLPAEAGGGQAPYPPGQYLALAPLLLVLGTKANGLDLATQATNALLDSFVAMLIARSLWRSGFGTHAVLFGVGLYLLPPPLLRSMSIGEFANLFGQSLAMMLLLIGFSLPAPRSQIVGSVGSTQSSIFNLQSSSECQQSSTLLWVQWSIGIAFVLLSHLGVSISLACLLAVLPLLWASTGSTGRRAALSLIAAGLLALTFTVPTYYASFGALLSERVGSGSGTDLGAALGRLIQLVLGLLRPNSVLYMPLIILGLLGAVRYAGARLGLPTLLSAWWLGTLLSLGLLLVAQQGVRWMHFLYPALCLGAGPVLAQCWRRGRAGQVVAFVLLAAILWVGGALWYNQLRTYRH